MPTKTIKIQNQLGLHARAAMKLSELAIRFGCKITLTFQERTINAKSILNVMALGASYGKQIEISTEGDDADQAMAAMTQLINDKFGEE